jgi:hypothetical protein
MEKKKNPFGTIDANENARQEVQDIINATAHAEQPEDEKKPAYSSYDDIYKMLSEQKAANDAQAADADRRARLAKTQEAIGGIYDLGRSIANLYGTTQYAPNINMESMSDKARARYDKAVAERKAYRDAAMNYLLQQNRMNVARDAAEQEQKNFERIQTEKERHNQEIENERKLTRELRDRESEWKRQLQEGKLDVAKLNAETRRMSEQYKRSRQDINHRLASWERTVEIHRDEMGRETGRTERRIVINPNSGELEVEETYTPTQQTSSKKKTTQPNTNNTYRSGWTKGSTGESLY